MRWQFVIVDLECTTSLVANAIGMADLLLPYAGSLHGRQGRGQDDPADPQSGSYGAPQYPDAVLLTRTNAASNLDKAIENARESPAKCGDITRRRAGCEGDLV